MIAARELDKLLKAKQGMKKRTMVWMTVALLLFYALSIYGCVEMFTAANNVVMDLSTRSIVNVSELNKESVRRSIENRSMLLKTLADRFEKGEVYRVEEIIDVLEVFRVNYDFYKMGIMDADGNLYITDSDIHIAPDPDFMGQVWNDQPHLLESRPSLDGSGYMVNTFTCPVYRDGEIVYVLTATYRSSELTDRMNISSLNGKGYTFLLNRQGDVVIYPRHYEDQDYNALMKYLNETPGAIAVQSGGGAFTYNGERYYSYFDELGVNDWFLLTCAREADVFADTRMITGVVGAAAAVLWLLILFFVGAGFYFLRRSRIRRTRELYYDPLLNLPNVRALEVVYEGLPREQLEQMYLFIFDVDKFKEYNYIHGRAGGDELLQYIADTLRAESPDSWLFRYYSDYFIVLKDYAAEQDYTKRVEQVMQRFLSDIQGGVTPPFEMSVGVRKIQPEDSLGVVITDALIARDTVKGNSLRHYAIYDQEIRNRRLAYMEIETSFASALRRKEFKVYYQPKYDMLTGRIIGAEALARWVRSDGRMVSPGDFIPCLEASRQIIMLDEEILSEVCRQMKRMEADGLDVKRVSVNLSRVHLRNPGILSKIAEIIHRFGIDPSKLSFEITETVLYEDSIPLKTIVDNLHALGCLVEMDDYGVGVSGPNSLAKNNFDVVKLDKSMVDGLGNERVEDVIRSTAYMAHKWGMHVLAEGVEERSQVSRLIELGCSRAQGFYYSRPVPEDEYRALLKANADEAEAESVARMNVRSFSEDARTLLDGYSLPTYIIDPESYVVMYANHAMCGYLGSDPTGGLCYEKLRGMVGDCEDCPVKRLSLDGDSKPKEVLGLDGRWAMLLTSPLNWQGREYVQISRVDITRQKQMESELVLRNKEYEVIVQQSLTGVVRYDIATDMATTNVDRSLNRVEEHPIPEYSLRLQDSGWFLPEGVERMNAMMSDIRANMPSRGYDVKLRMPQGDLRALHFDYALIPGEDGKPYRAVISFFDNTRQMRKELAYESWSAGVGALIDEGTIFVGVNVSQNVVELENRFGLWNQTSGAQRLNDFVEKLIEGWVVPEDVDGFRGFFNRERLMGLYYSGQREDALEYRTMMDGRPQWFRVSMQMAGDPTNHDVKASFVFRYVDAEVCERERLKYEAERDPLTGLYNRAATERLIREALEGFTGERRCFLLIDMDDLREVNSSLGHSEGDKALKAIADAMRGAFHEDAVLGRVGGDEFAAFLRNALEADEPRNAAFELARRLQDVSVGAHNQRLLRVSVGGVVSEAGTEDFKTLYERAELALDYAQMSGKNAVCFYAPEMENREALYQPAAAADAEWYRSLEIKRLVRAMSAFFPLVFSANLTRNTYRMMAYKPYIAVRAADEGDFDTLVQIGADAFHPDDREDFLAHFRRESLLRAYAEGKRIVSGKGRQQGADGVYRPVQTVVLFLEESEDGDICQITFAHVIGKELHSEDGE